MKKRTIDIQYDELERSHVLHKSLYLDAWLNSYSMLIPDGEKFVIRSIKKYMDRYDNNLKKDVSCLFYQEGQHSVEHQKCLDILSKKHYKFNSFIKLVRTLSYKILEPIFPSVLALSAASAIEHINAYIADHHIKSRILEDAHPRLKSLFYWHFAEEIEHKNVAYEALNSVSKNWFIRFLGLFLGGLNFAFLLFVGSFFLIRQKKGISWLSLLGEAFQFYFGPNGFFFGLVKVSWLYLARSFHPSQIDQKRSMDIAFKRHKELKEAVGFDFIKEEVERRHKLFTKNIPLFFSSVKSYKDPYVVIGAKNFLNLTSYSYLALANDPRVISASQEALTKWGSSAQAVRLLGGNIDLHHDLEAKIAKTFTRDNAVIFPSGYMANFSTISALMGKDDVIFADELVHASIIDGCRLSRSEIKIFPHNDIKNLKALINQYPECQKKLIVVDGVYSMDGDLCSLPELLEVRDKTPNTLLMMDEAHSLGVIGPDTLGTESYFGVNGVKKGVDLIMGSLSKAIPSVGGFIAGEKNLVRHIRFSARSNIFSASVPPSVAMAAYVGLEILETEGPKRSKALFANKNYLIHGLEKLQYEVKPSDSGIIPLMLRSEKKVILLCDALHKMGVYVLPVIYPAVSRGNERLRLMINCSFTKEHMDKVLEAFSEAKRKLDL